MLASRLPESTCSSTDGSHTMRHAGSAGAAALTAAVFSETATKRSSLPPQENATTPVKGASSSSESESGSCATKAKDT